MALAVARALGSIIERPPLSEDNVLGMISPAKVDGSAAVHDFPIQWTRLEVGLQSLAPAA